MWQSSFNIALFIKYFSTKGNTVESFKTKKKKIIMHSMVAVEWIIAFLTSSPWMLNAHRFTWDWHSNSARYIIHAELLARRQLRHNNPHRPAAFFILKKQCAKRYEKVISLWQQSKNNTNSTKTVDISENLSHAKLLYWNTINLNVHYSCSASNTVLWKLFRACEARSLSTKDRKQHFNLLKSLL